MTETITPRDAGTTAADLLGRLGTATPRERGGLFATGFDPLDEVLGGGFRAQDLAVLGGAPGVGKTVAALQWARWMAMTGRTAIYVCYQHSPARLMRRLLAMEMGSLARPDEAATLPRLLSIAQEVVLGAAPVDALTSDPLGEEAYRRLQEYGTRLHLVQGSLRSTGVVELARIVCDRREGKTALFVDPLDRVQLGIDLNDEARPDDVAEQLKELALVAEIPIVAIAAATSAGLTARRVQLHHLRGAAALAHSADVVILLNEKAAAVSTEHLAYAPAQAERFDHAIVLSVVKNVDGAPDLHVEFAQQLSSYRFDPNGTFVAESLVDPVLRGE